MSSLCYNCCKLLCKDRNSLEECSEKITFLQAGIIEQPKRVERTRINGKNRKLEWYFKSRKRKAIF